MAKHDHTMVSETRRNTQYHLSGRVVQNSRVRRTAKKEESTIEEEKQQQNEEKPDSDKVNSLI